VVVFPIAFYPAPLHVNLFVICCQKGTNAHSKQKIIFREASQEEGPGETEPTPLCTEDDQNKDQEIPG
jgi:hypothetical protein